MCGIIGYVGDKEATDILLDGLERLEYRGYDSAGMTVMGKDGMKTCKCVGRIMSLRQRADTVDLSGSLGIGHTRWATHGKPSNENAHPHLSNDGHIAVVHNGIIENHLEIKAFLEERGFRFLSETDTEVIPNLISFFHEDDLLSAVQKAVKMLKGSYALGIISASEPRKLIAVKKDSPLIIGVKDGEKLIASDIPAIISHTRWICIPEDGDVAVIEKDSMRIYSLKGDPCQRQTYRVDFDVSAAERSGYGHFMLKEINEQPNAIKNTLMGQVGAKKFAGLSKSDVSRINRLHIIACGTAYHAGLAGKMVIEKLVGIPTETDIASEYRYRDPLTDGNCLTVVISQSGETADTVAAMRLAKAKGSRVIAITNTVGSTVSREADGVFHTHAGPEIAVASTKAYTAQLTALYLLALFLARSKETVSEEEYRSYCRDLEDLPVFIADTLEKSDKIHEISQRIVNARDVFYIGRGLDSTLAMEGALKLKEISYIHAEAYAAGELKHGPIALIEKGTPVICISTSAQLHEKLIANANEVSARGAFTVGIIKEGLSNGAFDVTFTLQKANDLFMPVIGAIPLQLIAYYTSTLKGIDVDKPRNLAKSVTVE